MWDKVRHVRKDIQAVQAELDRHRSNPTGLAVDSKGNVFVVDSANNRIQELLSTGQYVAQWKAPLGGFKFTSKVAVDDHGNMYVSVGSQVLKLVMRSA